MFAEVARSSSRRPRFEVIRLVRFRSSQAARFDAQVPLLCSLAVSEAPPVCCAGNCDAHDERFGTKVASPGFVSRCDSSSCRHSSEVSDFVGSQSHCGGSFLVAHSSLHGQNLAADASSHIRQGATRDCGLTAVWEFGRTNPASAPSARLKNSKPRLLRSRSIVITSPSAT
jgi:hypothetical protein